MRHRKQGRKLGRPTTHRNAMLRNMVTSLMLHERIQTTDARAKELRRLADKIVTLGKRGDLHARRLAARVLMDDAAVSKLFTEIAPRFKERNGGYTRIIKVGNRFGDGAPVSVIELVDRPLGAMPEAEEAKPA